MMLQSAGHETAAAVNREDGMQAVAAFGPDLVILDVMMEQPDDGMVMAQDLRREGFENPILMLTSISKVTGLRYERDDDLVPVDAFVEKPVTPPDLMQQVDALLRKEG